MSFPFALVDLTHPLDCHVPTWTGGCGFHHDVHIDYADCQGQDVFRVMKVSMHAGIGTHMDAPSHCFPNGRCIHQFDVNELLMPCVVLDVAAHCHERYSLSAQDVMDFEKTHGPIAQGSCVLVSTGWSQRWSRPQEYHNHHVFPSVSVLAAELLLERGIRALGIDTLSPDRPEDGFGVHRLLLGHDKIIIENVANMSCMPPTGAYVLSLPLALKDGTESPVRLVGLIPSALPVA